MAISRRTLLLAGAAGLTAAAGVYAWRREPGGPVLSPIPAGPAPDGYVVSAYMTGDPVPWRVLDPRTGAYLPRARGVAACSPDMHYVLAYELPGPAHILDTASGALVHDFGETWNLPLGWSPDGRHIVVGSAVFHDVHSREDNYFTVDRVRIFDVASGAGTAVSGWVSTGLWESPWGSPGWTTDRRLVYGNRLIAMDGTVTRTAGDFTDALAILGTDRTISVTFDGDRRDHPRGAYLTGADVDIITGATRALPVRAIDAKRAGTDYSGLECIAWLDDDRVLLLRDHDLVVVDLRDDSFRPLMTFDDAVSDVRIAPAVGVPATIR